MKPNTHIHVHLIVYKIKYIDIVYVNTVENDQRPVKRFLILPAKANHNYS